MLLGLTYQLIRFIADLVLVRTRSDARLRAEVLALRHQLRVLERRVGKPAWQPADRLLLTALSRLLPECAVRLVCPAAEAGDLAPLAPRSGPPEVGGLSPAPFPATSCPRS